MSMAERLNEFGGSSLGDLFQEGLTRRALEPFALGWFEDELVEISQIGCLLDMYAQPWGAGGRKGGVEAQHGVKFQAVRSRRGNLLQISAESESCKSKVKVLVNGEKTASHLEISLAQHKKSQCHLFLFLHRVNNISTMAHVLGGGGCCNVLGVWSVVGNCERRRSSECYASSV